MTEAPKCEAQIGVRDFDGALIFLPCGAAATKRVELRDELLQEYVRHCGGWDNFRRDTILMGEDDPGANPGDEKWGDSWVLACDEHYDELRCDEYTHGGAMTVLRVETLEGG